MKKKVPASTTRGRRSVRKSFVSWLHKPEILGLAVALIRLITALVGQWR